MKKRINNPDPEALRVEWPEGTNPAFTEEQCKLFLMGVNFSWRRYDAMFQPYLDDLFRFTQDSSLKINRYYHNIPLWMFLGRFSDFEVGQISIQFSDDGEGLLSYSRWLDGAKKPSRSVFSSGPVAMSTERPLYDQLMDLFERMKHPDSRKWTSHSILPKQNWRHHPTELTVSTNRRLPLIEC